MTHPEILDHAGPLLKRYSVLFCDVWGVVHNGAAPFDAACSALQTFRRNGGAVILVSNAPVPKHRVQSMLDYVGVPDGIADDIVSSGDIAIAHISDVGYQHAYYIGPRDRDAAFFDAAGAQSVDLDRADAVVCTGLTDDRNENPEDYQPILRAALAHSLPFVCANPDFVVDVGDTRFFCAGAIADLYEQMGGTVYWAGKPHRSAYEAALVAAADRVGAAVHPQDVLVIGDTVRTDIEGAHRAGLESLFIAGGIHRDDVVRNGKIQPGLLRVLFSESAPQAKAAMVELTW